MARFSLIVFFLVGLSAIGAEVDNSPAENACYHPNVPSVTFDNLKADLLKNSISTSEQMLELFKISPSYRAFIQNPVFLKQSGALHSDEVMPRFPRVDSSNGNMVMHMTADPLEPGHQLVEFIEFMPSVGEYKFRAIDFALAGTPNMFVDDALNLPNTIEAVHEKAVGSFTSCAYCHHSDGLPIWSPRTLLHKAFGFGKDRIQFSDKGPDFSNEYMLYQKFQRIVAHPELGRIYRKFESDTTTLSDGSIVFTSNPAKTLTDRIYEKASYRISKKITDDPNYKNLQYAAVGAFLNCEDLESFLPDAVRQKREKKLLDSLRDDFWKSTVGTIWGDTKALAAKDLKPIFGPIYRQWVEDRKQLSDFAFNLKYPEGRFYPGEDILQATSLSPTQILKRGVNVTNEGQLRKSGVGFLLDDILQNDGFIGGEYVSVVGKLRYLFDGRDRVDPKTGETKPEDLTSWFPSLDESRGYVLGRGEKSLHAILACYIGPRFLQENTDLNFFDGSVVRAANLTIPKAEFCTKLKERSLAAFHQSAAL